jgi:hypothetical protein
MEHLRDVYGAHADPMMANFVVLRNKTYYRLVDEYKAYSKGWLHFPFCSYILFRSIVRCMLIFSRRGSARTNVFRQIFYEVLSDHQQYFPYLLNMIENAQFAKKPDTIERMAFEWDFCLAQGFRRAFVSKHIIRAILKVFLFRNNVPIGLYQYPQDLQMTIDNTFRTMCKQLSTRAKIEKNLVRNRNIDIKRINALWFHNMAPEYLLDYIITYTDITTMSSEHWYGELYKLLRGCTPLTPQEKQKRGCVPLTPPKSVLNVGDNLRHRQKQKKGCAPLTPQEKQEKGNNSLSLVLWPLEHEEDPPI